MDQDGSERADARVHAKISNLRVRTPGGEQLLEGVDLELRAGEVVVLLGGSGSGKSTLGKVLFEPDALRGSGFQVDVDALERAVPLGFVPQRGALIDHLDVAGNISLALRYSGDDHGSPSEEEVRRRLVELDLPASLARPGTPVDSLSGGQAQRVAVARTLAAGREALFLDEPSVGLDPARVRVLARQIRARVEEDGVACVVVTHDVSFTAAVADRILLLDAEAGRLVPLFEGRWPGAFESSAEDSDDEQRAERARWQWRLEQELVDRISASERPEGGRRHARGRRLRQLASGLLRPFAVSGAAIVDGAAQLTGHPGDYLRLLGQVLYKALLRPAPFYAVVSLLLGYTVLYVITGVVPSGIPNTKAVELLGSSHLIALVPPVSAFLFVAASGTAVNGWLGSMSLTHQIVALRSLGVSPRRYLWAPAWLGVGLSAAAASLVFALGMLVGGYLFCASRGIPDGWSTLTTDLFDPRPERLPYLVRATALAFVYAWGIASDVVADGTAEKRQADDVTRGMTGSVVRCTVWVVALELASIAVLFAARST